MPKSKKSKKSSRKPYKAPEPTSDPLYPARTRSQRVGGDVRPSKDLSRFVKWPRYVRVQRQRKILQQRLKVPPSINQFTRTLSKDQAREVFLLLNKYKPEDKTAKKQRLRAAAEAKAEGKEVEQERQHFCYVQYGLNHVTNLIEQKKAKLVLIASDVDPLELVIWMPALCRKMAVPYCIVKNKSRLGVLVGKKTATCVAVTGVYKEDAAKLNKMQDMCKSAYNDNTDALRMWGGGKMGLKTVRRLAIRKKFLDAEAAKKAKY